MCLLMHAKLMHTSLSKEATAEQQFKMRLVRTSNVLLFLSLILWLFAIGAGLRQLFNYEASPGRSGATPTVWPADSQLPRTSELPTLVMMIHPHCPCSRASIGELALLMTRVQGRVNVNVMFVKPKDFPEAWEQTDLWSSAAMIPGVKVRVDEGGVEAQRFGSQTSGQIMLYSTDGRLLFSGGITVARGHAGDNDGRSAIVALLTNNSSEIRETPVFGCPIFGQTSNAQPKDSCHAIHSN